MRNLSDTISRLSALRKRSDAILPAGVPSRLTPLRAFGSNPGSLEARVHLPSRPAPGAALVVVLHGCTQTADGYDHGSGWSRLADEQGFFLLFPEQQRSNNPNLCFNWFLPEHTQRGRGEALSIHQMIEAMLAAHDIDAKRVFITGLSAGGAMTATMLALYPEVFAGGAIIAGLAHGVARGVPEAFDRMRAHALPSPARLQAALRSASAHRGPWPSISIWQGTADSTVHAANADAIVDQWREALRLGAAPSATRRLGIRTIREWSDRDGRVQVTHHSIDGMGHGTPIASTGPNAGGRAGPYMLDVGIASTREIADSWGLTSRAGHRAAPVSGTEAISGDAYVLSDSMPTPNPPAEPAPRFGAAASTAQAGPVQVGQVIEAALRAAGLMK